MVININFTLFANQWYSPSEFPLQFLRQAFSTRSSSPQLNHFTDNLVYLQIGGNGTGWLSLFEMFVG